MGKFFYKPEPVFGLDIGHSSIKVMQLALDETRSTPQVLGYGQADFKANAVNNGVIAKPQIVAEQVFTLLTETMVGGVNSKQFVTAAPVANTYNSLVKLPKMKKSELKESVILEAEQVIPLPLDQLYIDYQIVSTNDDSHQVMFVAVPKTIVDSYVKLAELLGLELRAIETTIDSTVRIISKTIEDTDNARLIIDLGSLSSDLAVWDSTLQVTSVVNWGGDHLTRDIQNKLNISHSKAATLKRRYGIGDGPQQKKLYSILESSSTPLIKEAKRILRFYERRKDGAKIDQIIIVGGGSSLKGVRDFLSDKLDLDVAPTTALDVFDFGSLQPPHPSKFGTFTTVAGLAMIKEAEI